MLDDRIIKSWRLDIWITDSISFSAYDVLIKILRAYLALDRVRYDTYKYFVMNIVAINFNMFSLLIESGVSTNEDHYLIIIIHGHRCPKSST